MKKDHYSVLGVTPASEDVVIRAAYRALMRRYHPDADSSVEAAERAREINEAYRVLSDPARRARYDEGLAASSPLQFDPQPHPDLQLRGRSRAAPAAAIGFTVLAAGMVAFAVSPTLPDFATPPSPPAEGSRSNVPVERVAAANPETSESRSAADLCSEPSANGLIRQELFRQAAKRRPADRAQLERVASYAHVRIDPRKGQGAGSAGCTGWLAINLPRGLVVDGGRSNLNADIAFVLVRGNSGFRLAKLSGTDGLVRSLATLGPESVEAAGPAEIAAAEPVPKPIVETPRRAAAAAAPVRKAHLPAPLAASASSACSAASSRSEQILCANSNLSSLDRQLNLLYRQSWKQADAKKRAALIGTRQRFNDRRDACGSPNCMTTAYVSRLREISDIMAGKVEQ